MLLPASKVSDKVSSACASATVRSSNSSPFAKIMLCLTSVELSISSKDSATDEAENVTGRESTRLVASSTSAHVLSSLRSNPSEPLCRAVNRRASASGPDDGGLLSTAPTATRALAS